MAEEEKEVTQNRIGQDFDLWGIIAFTLPSILMQLCSQMFRTLDDGLFVSRYVGSLALASINLLNPLNSISMGITHLFSLGGSTMAAKIMGQGNQQEAKRVFTRVTVAAAVLGSVFAAIVNIFATPIATYLGADESTLANSLIYIRIVFSATPFHILSVVLNSFYATCGAPKMGLINSIINGAVNIILDIVLIPVLKLGVVGSSLSTALGDIAVVIVGLIFFSSSKHEIHFVNPEGNFVPTAIESAKYGSSQFVNSLSLGLYSLVSNKVILAAAGADGISASAIVSDLRRIMNAAVMGYVSCVAPIIAYNCGSKNHERLKKVLSYNMTYWFFMSLIVSGVGELLRTPLLHIFFKENYSQFVYDLTYQGLSIEYAGIIFTTGTMLLNRMLVSMSEIKLSTLLSFMRNVVFRIMFILIIPAILGMTGVWLAFPVSEMFSFTLGVICIAKVLPKFGFRLRDLRFRFD